MYRGETTLPDDIYDAPPTALSSNAHYELIVEAFGGKGFFVQTYQELLPALKYVPLFLSNALGTLRSEVPLWITR